MTKYRLFHYWRSSSSWRVRWALQLKGIDAELVAVNLLGEDAESPEHRLRNPMGYVPVLERVDAPAGTPDKYLVESTAIIEYLEEIHSEPRLLPSILWSAPMFGLSRN